MSTDVWLKEDPYSCPRPDLCYMHNPDLRADIAARVPVAECEEPGCVHWAMPDGRCHHLHGGSDPL